MKSDPLRSNRDAPSRFLKNFKKIWTRRPDLTQRYDKASNKIVSGQIGTRRPAFWKFLKKSGQAVPIWPQGMIKLVTKSWGVKSGQAVPLIIGLMHLIHVRVYKIQPLGVKSGQSVQLVGQRVQFWPQWVGFVSGTVCSVLTPSVQKSLTPQC